MSIAMLPYLQYCGVEICNAARTVTYLDNGLVESSHFSQDVSPLPSILWRARGYSESFTSPVLDDAPWYKPGVVESGDFLGLICDSMLGLDTTETRASTATGTYRGGSVLAGATLGEREIKLHGWLIASSCDGLEYGRRWLADLLGAGPDACMSCDLQVRLVAPPEDGSDDTRGAWRLYRVALRSLVVTDPVGCCDLREVNLTLVAGDPVLYKEPVVCLDNQVLSPSAVPPPPEPCWPFCDWLAYVLSPAAVRPCIPFDEWFCGPALDEPLCCIVDPPEYGSVAPIITFQPTGETFGGARITINPSCPAGSGAPAVAEMDTGPIPDGSVLVVDAARRLVTFVDSAGAAWDGVPYLTLPAHRSVPWLEVSSRDAPACICVEPLAPCAGGGLTYVTISTQAWAR